MASTPLNLGIGGLPITTVGRLVASILSTATSVCRSTPTTPALNSRLSVNDGNFLRAVYDWALVRMRPSALTMKPEPCPCIGTRPRGMGPWKRLKNS